MQQLDSDCYGGGDSDGPADHRSAGGGADTAQDRSDGAGATLDSGKYWACLGSETGGDGCGMRLGDFACLGQGLEAGRFRVLQPEGETADRTGAGLMAA